MATMRANPRLQVGSAAWIAEERSSALQIVEAESEEFSYSVRTDVDWLNEHMADIFSKNQINVAEIFKTPGKLRGKTPRTIRKANPLEARAPLSDVFSATPQGAPSPLRQAHFERPVATFQVAEDEPEQVVESVVPASSLEEDVFAQKSGPNNFDSGYFGSQYATQQTQPTQPNDPIEELPSPKASPPKPQILPPARKEDEVMHSPESEEGRSTEVSFQSAKEEQTRNMNVNVPAEAEPQKSPVKEVTRVILESPLQSRILPPSPQKRSPQRPIHQSPPKVAKAAEKPIPVAEDEPMEDVASPISDGSDPSPIRPIVRKSSLNFASLPAREPITTKKSIGNRVSRTSHLEQSRASYYGRQTGGKSLGNTRQEETQNEDDDDMDLDEPEQKDPMSRLHNKTSTQRLQDQISMLGKSQSNNARPASKSIVDSVIPPQSTQTVQPPVNAKEITRKEVGSKSPQRQSAQRKPFVAPGAFPDDEDDSWIGPPNVATTTSQPSIFSPRPHMTKSHSTDVMEGIRGKDSIGGESFSIPKRGEEPRQRSPIKEPAIPERTTSTLGHIKSVSTSVLRSPKKAGDSPGQKKPISVSNPNPSIGSDDGTPPKSPSRSYKGSPLKAAKDKFSSILKTSRGLFASSAAVSAEAKTSTMSPAQSRMGLNSQPSFEDVLQGRGQDNFSKSQHSQRVPDSPGKSVRKTRASTEREERKKEEDAREAKEAKEEKKMVDQLEKARQKVKEEARVYHLEQERVAAMQKEVAARREQERLAKASQVDIPRATRSSPRKTKAQLEAEGIAAAAASTDELSGRDVDMTDASAMPPPARPKSQIGRPAAKRPLKPAKETVLKNKPPTIIQVNTGSQREHVGHQYHPSTSTLAATLQESLSAPSQAGSSQPQLRKQASTSSMQSSSSRNGFKSAATKALEAAARKKEQDEIAAQRKKEAKLEVERQRAAIKEEERRREEQQRRQEAERQRTIQRAKEQAAAAADAKRSASRQAMEKKRLEMEKAKMTGAPPPALRPQPSGDLTMSMLNDKPLPSVPRGETAQSKPSHMNSTVHRPQDDASRPANPSMHTATKVPPKRPLQQDDRPDNYSRPTMSRNPPSFQHNDNHSKRRKTSDVFDDDDDMTSPPAKLTAPPIRQSTSRPKDMQPKSIFPFASGYTNAPQPANLQKATVMSQHHMSQNKPAHPLDMAQVSKAPIPFANSSQGNAQHKTPARPGASHHGGKSAKSTAKASPKYQDGDKIELPEINTDSEDEDSDGGNEFPPVAWAESPAIRQQLAIQEGVDPMNIFGPPAPLNMEEVFSKSKDRFPQFRKRTSSANWSGQDRLTSEEIRKDLEARDRIRRQGGWTHNTMV